MNKIKEQYCSPKVDVLELKFQNVMCVSTNEVLEEQQEWTGAGGWV